MFRKPLIVLIRKLSQLINPDINQMMKNRPYIMRPMQK